MGRSLFVHRLDGTGRLTLRRPGGVRRAVAAATLCMSAAALAAPAQNIGAIGQIVPSGGLISVNGVLGGVVREVRVHLGDVVKPGDVLLVVDSEDPNSDRSLAMTRLDGEKKLAREQVAVQTLAVRLAQRKVDQAGRDLAAYRSLSANATSASEKSRLESVLEQAQLTLQMEQSRLQVTTTQSENSVHAAEREVEIASTNNEIRAPVQGTVLRLSRKVGERIGNDPAIQIGDLRTMYVDCQVYEGDILKLAPGMSATIKSPALQAPLHGRIEQIGRMIDSRAKLGDVRIKLDVAEPAARLVGMEVEVSITP
jgi:multidrug resistance efflux pump